eukprot:6052841-Alexandrium_andersonii.AAC.1
MRGWFALRGGPLGGQGTMDSIPEGRYRCHRRQPPPPGDEMNLEAWWPCSQSTVVVSSSDEEACPLAASSSAPDPRCSRRTGSW